MLSRLVVFVLVVCSLIGARDVSAQNNLKYYTSNTGVFYKTFHVTKDPAEMAKAYDRFKLFISKIDISKVEYPDIIILKGVTDNYSALTKQDQSIPKIDQATELYKGLREFFGSSFSTIESRYLSDYVDEVYRSLDLGDVVDPSKLDVSVKTLLFKNGMAKFCFLRDVPSGWPTTDHVITFRQALEAKEMYSVYKLYFTGTSLKPSSWFNDVWDDPEYIAYENGLAVQPGVSKVPWTFKGVIQALDFIISNPSKNDADLFIDKELDGLAEAIILMSSIIDDPEQKDLLLGKAIEAGSKLVDLARNNKVRKLLESYIAKYEAAIKVLRSEPRVSRSMCDYDYYEDGKIRTNTYFSESGAVVNYREYYPTGGVKITNNYDPNTHTLVSSVERNEKGLIVRSTSYENGKLKEYKEYSSGGKLVLRSFYDENGLQHVKEFQANGKLSQHVYDAPSADEYDVVVDGYDSEGRLEEQLYFKGSNFVKSVRLERDNSVNVDHGDMELRFLMNKLDLYVKNLADRGFIINDADLVFMLGEDGALNKLAGVYESNKLDHISVTKISGYATILLSVLIYNNDALSAVDTELLSVDQYSQVIAISARIELLSTAPAKTLVFMQEHKIFEYAACMKIIDGYAKLISKVSGEAILKK